MDVCVASPLLYFPTMIPAKSNIHPNPTHSSHFQKIFFHVSIFRFFRGKNHTTTTIAAGTIYLAPQAHFHLYSAPTLCHVTLVSHALVLLYSPFQRQQRLSLNAIGTLLPTVGQHCVSTISSA
uniref:Uncharacterized protein n=1 Tax=Ditylum brightwellii TaxID=49249 RepID=A0A7S4RPY2_9STRA